MDLSHKTQMYIQSSPDVWSLTWKFIVKGELKERIVWVDKLPGQYQITLKHRHRLNCAYFGHK